MAADGVDVAGLRDLYAQSAVARAFLDHAAQRERDWSETSVERTLTILNTQGSDVSRGEVVSLFKHLEELGCGQFIIGRRGKPSRIAWSASIVSVGRAAVGEQQVVVELPPTEVATEAINGELLTHTYHLRLASAVTFALPADLSPQEAARLAAFIKTLPIGE